MLQIRKILLRGDAVEDALVEFERGANVLAGESDTGKSYLVECLDFILGSQKLKVLNRAANYSNLFVEFENSRKESLTLIRPTDGGNLRAYYSSIKAITGSGIVIAPVRKGTSKAADITSILFSFAGINEAKLRKNVNGETQRLSVRTLAPLFLINEVAIIDEYSPILGQINFNTTVDKRAFSYLLTGKDDTAVIATTPDENIKSRLKAKLEVVEEMLAPLEVQYGGVIPVISNDDEDVEEAHIKKLSYELQDFGIYQDTVQQEIQELTKATLKSDSQLLGIAELKNRYLLLDERYTSDLDRLDFIAEGAHYIGSLQDVNCPLCAQTMPGHERSNVDSPAVRESAIAEASKIKAHKRDLEDAIFDIDVKEMTVKTEKQASQAQLQKLQEDLSADVGPRMADVIKLYEKLIDERAVRELRRTDGERWSSLLKLKAELEDDISINAEPKQKWNGLSPLALRELCLEIETVLKEWSWGQLPRVEFDEKEYDIVVDGQPRNSHGKGVRAILYSAFTVGLLNYCVAKKKPHPGFVVLDSPLTSFKKNGASNVTGPDGQISAGVEAAFWNSLKTISKDIQVIVIENKEPSADVKNSIHYEWFAGLDAKDGERAGLFP